MHEAYRSNHCCYLLQNICDRAFFRICSTYTPQSPPDTVGSKKRFLAVPVPQKLLLRCHEPCAALVLPASGHMPKSGPLKHHGGYDEYLDRLLARPELGYLGLREVHFRMLEFAVEARQAVQHRVDDASNVN